MAWRSGLLLGNAAQHVRQVPGRKTDISDAAWLCQLGEPGLRRASCRPSRSARLEPCALPQYPGTRAARQANRLHKAARGRRIKLDRVVSDILGVSGGAMLDALVAGMTDPAVHAGQGPAA